MNGPRNNCISYIIDKYHPLETFVLGKQAIKQSITKVSEQTLKHIIGFQERRHVKPTGYRNRFSINDLHTFFFTIKLS